jgi:hypothetical protein
MEHYVERKLILLEDVSYPLSYYMQHCLGDERETFLTYMEHYKLQEAAAFFKRLERISRISSH